MFSVIICTYNRSGVLRSAIRSALVQTYGDFELIVVDDGSTDDSRRVIEEFRDVDRRVRAVYRDENGGVARARNCGIFNADREWVTFLDSDDEYMPEHLQVRAEYIRKHPETDLIHSPAEVVGNQWVCDRRNPTSLISVDDCRIGGTFFVRRSKAIEIGGFPEVDYGDDSAFFDLAERYGLNIRFLDVRTYVYNRVASDTITRKMEMSERK